MVHPAARSASERIRSRWSGSPASSVVSHEPHTPFLARKGDPCRRRAALQDGLALGDPDSLARTREPKGCAVSGPVAGQFQIDCRGRRPTQAPKWSFTAGLEQVVPLRRAGNLRFNAGTRYQSGVYTGFELLPVRYQTGYFMSNAQLEYSTLDVASQLPVLNNIEDNNVVGYSQPHPQAGGAWNILSLRPPPTYGIGMGAMF